MTVFTGKGVCGGAAIGKIFVHRRQNIEIRRRRIDNPDEELARLARARGAAAAQLQEICEKAREEVGDANACIFEIHMMMTEDEDFCDAMNGLIREQRVNAEYAAAMTADRFAQQFAAMDDSYMQARAADVHDVANRIIACLQDSGSTPKAITGRVILCADDLAPSETVTFDRGQILAFVTAKGSVNSHTAILARTMNIPAIIGVGEGFLKMLRDGVTAIADGDTGELLVNPAADTLAAYEKKLREERVQKARLETLRGKPNVTIDGTSIKIYANIGSIAQVEDALMNDAGGIGLFRSEFLYLESSDYPSEETQFQVYKRVLERMGDKRVIIRTLDIGADKQAAYFRLAKEENPALGLRAIRLCLTRQEIFRTQLRALYRASVYGRLGIMFPMITSTGELREILDICESVRSELQSEGLTLLRNPELGIMIETPAAAVISDRLAPMVDFFSVGTNDLIQYTLACDRQNPKLDRFCDSRHEAVLRLIAMSAENAHAHGKWIGICGELAADTVLTSCFLRMGIDELSVSPAYVLKLREAVRQLDLREDGDEIQIQKPR